MRVNQSSPLTSGFTTGEGFDNNLPLVAVEVNGKSSQGTVTPCYCYDCPHFFQEGMLETALRDLSTEKSWLMKHSGLGSLQTGIAHN